jgi:hypothetical protein
MFSKITTALLVLITSISTTATLGQVLQTNTARSYLPTATTFNQSQIDSFNNTVNYQHDIVNGSALSYPDMQPITLIWNGTAWEAPQPIAITNAFTSPLMVGAISHTATATAGALNPSILVDWSDVVGTTQYRFRFRTLGGTWNASTITGSQRAMNTLQYNTTYEVQVRVYINSTTQGEYTQSYTFTTPQFVLLPSCNAPSVTGSIIGNVMTLQWNAISQATAYQVEIRQLGALSYGGTTTSNTSFSMTVQRNTSYEYRVRSSCTGTATSWSEFSTPDTLENATCQPPTNLQTSGNTFSWNANQYAQRTQIQHRLVGSAEWGGTTVLGNSWTNPQLVGNHEWRVRSVCYGTSNTGWTAWAYGTMSYNPNSFEQFSTELAYPNPASDVIKFNGRIVVQDLSGRIITQGENEVDVTHLANGLYIVNNKKHIIKH